ncbi:EAL domain-containing protein [Bowmanella sp. Y26]|uniref:two-component system response regulator n=1 Tax=Bowmanella yangjiangensis TaxID=2811230 RepID=UPI001BDBDB96|nr:EAL domain-containing protein [Bowmanella yangjiangensis]MBT1066148.1 EAL domain-containing protein [Bowmanella yangjiangensis]
MLFNPQREDFPTILIVDDEAVNRIILEDALQTLGKILHAESGEEALRIAYVNHPNVVMLDIDLPGIDGFEVCRRLKANQHTAECAVIFVTSHSESSYEYHSLAQGGIDFISKPIDFGLCRLRVKNQLILQQQTKALRTAKDDLHELVTQVPVFISCWSKELANWFSNDFEGDWFGINAKAMAGQQMQHIFPASLFNLVQKKIMEELPRDTFTAYIPEAIGGIEYAQVYLTKRRVLDEEIGYLLTLVDVTTVRRAKHDLMLEKERLKVTLNSIGDAVIATDTDARVTFMNPIAERMTGMLSREAKGIHIESVMNLCDADTKKPGINPISLALQEKRIVAMALNSQLTSKNGEVYRVEDSAAPIRDDDGNIIGAIIVFHDVSESIAMAVKMSYLANHDQLTDLPNRILLHDRLGQACKMVRSTNKLVAVFLIDIDHFKYLNDSLGHHHGDLIIKQVAKRLESLVDTSATLARIGGDEFVLVVPGIRNSGIVDSIATAIVKEMGDPFIIEAQEYRMTVSVGISLNPTDADDEESLMRHADVAMYRAKKEGRNRYCYFSEELEAQLLQRHNVELMLRAAITNNGLEVHYQPQIELCSGRIIGAEALVRLRDAKGNLVSPIHFIPLAEETGLINQVGHQVMRKACQAASNWHRRGHRIRLSVNIAAKQFVESNLSEDVAELLQETGLAPELLELEVTESALMDNFEETQNILNSLSGQGVSIAIDDFGTGYSSLSYMKAFPIDVLKIDQSFVRDMLLDKQSLDIVKTIAYLASSLGLTLIGEGIEEEEQKRALIDLKCEFGQGYLFSKPLPLEDFEALLE